MELWYINTVMVPTLDDMFQGSLFIFKIMVITDYPKLKAISAAFILLVSIPCSSSTNFMPFGLPLGNTIFCTLPFHCVSHIAGCAPPGFTFIHFMLGASLLYAQWQLLWSKSQTSVFESFGYLNSAIAIAPCIWVRNFSDVQ